MRSAKDDDTVRPILLTLYQATDVTVQNIKMINGPEWINFVSRQRCFCVALGLTKERTWQVNEGKNVVFRNITISAVSTSSHAAKNTDGWDIFRSDNVTIADSDINNGDDCVSFKPSTRPSSMPSS